MKSTIITVILVLSISLTGFSKDVRQLIVYDAINRDPIPYVTVKVLHTTDGTYSDEAGKFEVKISDKDSLLLTCVGYQSKIIVPQRDTILLDPIMIHIQEVNVKPLKEQSIGLFKSKTGIKFYFTSSINYELALKISIPESYTFYRIKGVKLDALNTKARSLARLHIYSQNKDGLPDMELLTEDIIINTTFQANSIIDLSRLNLILNNRTVFVGIEAIKGNISYKPHSGDCIGFGLTLTDKRPITYSRTLQDPKYLWTLDFSKSWTNFPGKRSNSPANLKVSLIID